MIMKTKTLHYCGGYEECRPVCGEVPILDVSELPQRTVILWKGVAWQKQSLPLNGWLSTDSRWISNGVMCGLEDQITVLWTEE